MAKSSLTRILFTGLTGLAAGVAIGLLLAPESGSKTRKKLKKRLREVSEKFQEEFSDEIEKLKSALHLDDEEEPKQPVMKKRPKPKT